MRTYTLTSSTLPVTSQVVVRDDGANIPPDAGNADFVEYTLWLAAGNTPSPPVSREPVIPEEVTDRQFVQSAALCGVITREEALAYVRVGQLPAVIQAAVAAISDPDDQFAAEMKISGAHAFRRSDALLAALATADGVTAGILDDVFRLAATL